VFALSLLIVAQPPAVKPLWPQGQVPLAVGTSDTDTPSLAVFPAPNGQATGRAVVICPGGGYGALADQHEGKQVAELFNSVGFTAYVLKYRIATKDRPGPLGKAPLLDAQRAIQTARDGGATTVGLVGFSAGGHLASTAATHTTDGSTTSNDPVARQSSRPDFLVLGYPVVTTDRGVTHGGSVKNLLGDKPTRDQLTFFSNEKHVTRRTPPTFIFHTDEDTAVPPENALRFALALKQHGVPCELHLYQKGKHGVGLGGGLGDRIKPEPYVAGWPERLTAWLTLRGLTGK
jgi:acetyl esterase/lipase